MLLAILNLMKTGEENLGGGKEEERKSRQPK
jgi:hypothetical protein